MNGNLPPGVADSDIDEAAPGFFDDYDGPPDDWEPEPDAAAAAGPEPEREEPDDAPVAPEAEEPLDVPPGPDLPPTAAAGVEVGPRDTDPPPGDDPDPAARPIPREVALLGVDLFGNIVRPKASQVVASRFMFNPFTLFDAKQGEWQDRKRAWIAIGIRSEEGRAEDITYTGSAARYDYYREKEGLRKPPPLKRGGIPTSGILASKVGVPGKPPRAYNIHNWIAAHPEVTGGEPQAGHGTSIFDPVLCEMLYRWFCPQGGQVLDPFAGGSVRGIVAGALARKYWGCDLSERQVLANREQAEEIELPVKPVWVCGDSAAEVPNAPETDFILSCPPYGDLEVYSNDPRDLSHMDFDGFIKAYRIIICQAVTRLRRDRFACFVVGDFRGPDGYYRDFVSQTILAFEAAGARLYNEAILETMVGSAAMRVSKQFEAGRKLAKIHQNILIFCRGDWKKAAEACATSMGDMENNVSGFRKDGAE